jgi:hypothetical protein
MLENSGITTSVRLEGNKHANQWRTGIRGPRIHSCALLRSIGEPAAKDRAWSP